ncbi:MAG: hypothetical protein ABJA71_14250 [Ginsengibacter sp.]
MAEEERESYKSKLLKTGDLPLKNMAEIELKKIETEMLAGKLRFHELIKNADQKKLPIDILIDYSRLRGTITGVYNDMMIVVSWSKSETKYLLDAYINYLAARASGYEVKMYFISYVKDDVFLAAEISQGDALKKLKELLQLYKQGHENILVFDPGFKIKPDAIENVDDRTFKKELKDKLDNFNFVTSDNYMNNEYINGFYAKENVIEDYKKVARKLLFPLAHIFPEYYQKH